MEHNNAIKLEFSPIEKRGNIVERYHVTVLSNFARGFDKYSRSYSKDRISESRFKDKFHLLKFSEIEIGVEKNKLLLRNLDQPNNCLIVLKTVVGKKDLFKNTDTGLGEYILDSSILLDSVYFINSEKIMRQASFEELMAHSLTLNMGVRAKFSELVPRSVSILPVAIGCQAKCSFCFSKSSASSKQKNGFLDEQRIEKIFIEAKEKRVQRAVITGGGEPTLYPKEKLLSLIRLAGKYFPNKVVLITNGYEFAKLSEQERLKYLLELQSAGLTTIAISRHHWNEDVSEKIMSLRIDIESIANTMNLNTSLFDRMSLRLICVLQSGFIDSEYEIHNYLQWAAEMQIEEVCFKELYVSSSVESIYYSDYSNEWSYRNQAPLSKLLNYFKNNGWFKEAVLPWGAPIYVGSIDGKELKVAAYTEPSLLWELDNQLCRSWNIMADGKCLTSLEDRASEIFSIQ